MGEKAPYPRTDQENMSNAKDTMPKLMEIDGCLGGCLVDSNSGMLLAQTPTSVVNLAIAAASNT